MSACKTIDIYQVDAFTDVPFGGNPAGVVPDAAGLDEREMQLIAREMNVSETAFVLPATEPGANLRVRFFTPANEVDLCGHATIGTFYLLAATGRLTITPGTTMTIHQQTGAGVLPVDITATADGGTEAVMMTQTTPKFWQPIVDIDTVARILGLDRGEITGPVQAVSTGLPDLIVPVKDLAALRHMDPDMPALAKYCAQYGIIGVHPFTFETIERGSTVHCRDFAPAVGIIEEAATGTASGALGAYLVQHGLVRPSVGHATQDSSHGSAHEGAPGGAFTITCEQGHMLGRPSLIRVEVTGSPGRIEQVRVGGRAVIVLSGKMSL